MKTFMNRILRKPGLLIGMAVVLVLLFTIGLRKTLCLATVASCAVGLMACVFGSGSRRIRMAAGVMLVLMMILSATGLVQRGKAPSKPASTSGTTSASASSNVGTMTAPYTSLANEDDLDYSVSYDSYCYNCGNTGICPHCHGSRRTERTAYSINLGSGSHPYTEYRMCVWCSGTGRCTHCSW